MSSVATGEYYRLLNQRMIAQTNRGPQIAMFSVDFAEIEGTIRERRWDDAAAVLADGARRIEAAGADFLLLATNTMHMVAPEIAAAISIPLLHIVDATAAVAVADGATRLGVLGTRPVMEPGFYSDRFAQHGIELLMPPDEDAAVVEQIIFAELTRHVVRNESKTTLLRIADEMIERGAAGVVLGCTELSLVLTPGETSIRLYDTTDLHVNAAISHAIEMEEVAERL
jgi:aspartate racemase